MVKPARFVIDHILSTRDEDIPVQILWEYHPGCTGTYYDPPELPDVQIVEFQLPDHLEHRRKEVEWLIEDQMEDLGAAALEVVNEIYNKWRGYHDIKS